MEAVRIALLLVAAALACAAMRVQRPELAAGVAQMCIRDRGTAAPLRTQMCLNATAVRLGM